MRSMKSTESLFDELMKVTDTDQTLNNDRDTPTPYCLPYNHKPYCLMIKFAIRLLSERFQPVHSATVKFKIRIINLSIVSLAEYSYV